MFIIAGITTKTASLTLRTPIEKTIEFTYNYLSTRV